MHDAHAHALTHTHAAHTQIDDGIDFFDFEGKVDIIITNPPFSEYTKFVEKCIALRPRVLCLLFGSLNASLSRFKMLFDAGYTLTKQHQTDWREMIGPVYVLHFELGVANTGMVAHTYDFVTHKSDCP